MWKRFLDSAFGAWLALGATPFLGAGELTVSHAALERLLWTTLMTQGGRHYLEGQPEDTCRFAFIQEPRVAAEQGRLKIRFVFSGRAGVLVGSRCVGPGDTFDLAVTGVPMAVDGELRLGDPQVSVPDSNYYRLVSGLIESRLREELRYPLRAQMESALAAASSGPLRIALKGLRVGGIVVDADAVRISFDAEAIVR